jgi:hypothetical protein
MLFFALVLAQFLPPLLPEEFSYQLKQTYLATTVDDGTVLNNVVSVATQYWSLANLGTRGLVSSAAGIDKGLPGTVINRLTVTNYSNTASGSLEVDLVTRQCTYYSVEGGASYPGPSDYRNTLAAALASGTTPAGQYNLSDFVHGGESYGPVNIWWLSPSTGIVNRTLTYTLVFPEGSNQPLGYLVNGTEHLPNAVTGGIELVNLEEAEIRTGYDTSYTASSWPESYFSTEPNCPFVASPPPPPPQGGCYEGGLHTNSTGVWATGAAITAFAGILLGGLIGAAIHKHCARPKMPPGDREMMVGGGSTPL